jgi:hypothetical protein
MRAVWGLDGHNDKRRIRDGNLDWGAKGIMEDSPKSWVNFG